MSMNYLEKETGFQSEYRSPVFQSTTYLI